MHPRHEWVEISNYRCRLAGERVGEGGAEGHEGDGRELVLEAHQAAEDGGEVADDDGESTDHGQGDEEAEPAAGHPGRGDEGKDQLKKTQKRGGNSFVPANSPNLLGWVTPCTTRE